jgi:RNA polymerase sigma factor (TIGR02999 family)
MPKKSYGRGVYEELRQLARSELAREGRGHSLQPTSLVHEAYLRLLGGEEYDWANRRQFFAAAAKSMRRIRIDDARRRKRLKRGGAVDKEALDGDAGAPAFDDDPSEVLAVHDALSELEQVAPRAAAVVEQRYFGGMSMPEVADALGISARTAEYDWHYARAWLRRSLSSDEYPG